MLIAVNSPLRYCSRNEAVPPIPQLGDAFTHVTLPPSLVLLQLEDVIVSDNSVLIQL